MMTRLVVRWDSFCPTRVPATLALCPKVEALFTDKPPWTSMALTCSPQHMTSISKYPILKTDSAFHKFLCTDNWSRCPPSQCNGAASAFSLSSASAGGVGHRQNAAHTAQCNVALDMIQPE